MPYEAKEYWSQLHDRGDLSSVGQSALSPALNAWIYRALEHRVRWFIRRHRVLDSVTAAFDVGAGTGYWTRRWHDLGVTRVDGCDLVPAAVERLTTAFGPRGDRFIAADIGAPDFPDPVEGYGLVSVMNVLLHITDDNAFRVALGNVASLVDRGGSLLLVEPILLDPSYERVPTQAQTSRARTLAAYREPLEAAGLKLVDVRAAQAMANNPIEAGSRAAYARYSRWWRWVARQSRESPERVTWIGPLMLALDRVALTGGAAPSSKMALFRRP